MTGNCTNKLSDGCIDACNFCNDNIEKKKLQKQNAELLQKVQELEKKIESLKIELLGSKEYEFMYKELCKQRRN